MRAVCSCSWGIVCRLCVCVDDCQSSNVSHVNDHVNQEAESLPQRQRDSVTRRHTLASHDGMT